MNERDALDLALLLIIFILLLPILWGAVEVLEAVF